MEEIFTAESAEDAEKEPEIIIQQTKPFKSSKDLHVGSAERITSKVTGFICTANVEIPE